MLRPGTKVESLTKKAGQSARHGTVEAVRGTTVEVRWDDGHLSVISRHAIRPVRRSR